MTRSFRSPITWFLILLILAVGGWCAIRYYDYIFSERVEGKIIRVEHVNAPTSVISTGGGSIPNSQIFSFAIAIEIKGGMVRTASSEDRQWAVATAGQCVVARYFPYPPWQLDKAGTFHDARLLELRNCP